MSIAAYQGNLEVDRLVRRRRRRVGDKWVKVSLHKGKARSNVRAVLGLWFGLMRPFIAKNSRVQTMLEGSSVGVVAG